jgi:hypothetical protein
MNLLLSKTFVAGGAIPPNSIVKFGADDNTVVVATAAADASIGVSQNTIAAALGERVDVMIFGIADVKLGTGGITRGAEVTSDASGQGVAAASTNRVIGISLASGVAGDIVPVVVSPATK